MITPVELPLQSTSMIEVDEIVKFDLGSVIVTLVELVQPFLSLIPMVYVPAARFENVPEV